MRAKFLLASLCTVSMLVPTLALLPANPAGATPGAHTAAQVNAAVASGVAHIDTLQNGDGSFGAPYTRWAETGYALVAYGVLANGAFSNLSASYQAHVKNAITFLLTSQDTGAGIDQGSWSPAGDGYYKTYNTGSALAGLSFFTGVDPGVSGAITAGRTYLTNTFQAPPHYACTTTPSDPTSAVCGGWNYDSAPGGHSDASNTGFAMTGLQLTGGIPAAIKPVNTAWQHNIQAITTNLYSTRNDGGGGYEPDCASGCGSFSSNANDTGSMLFGLGDDGVAASDPNAAAGIKFGNDVIDEYLLEQTAGMHTMVFHTGASEDGTCVIGGACDWQRGSGEGGYHYSLFALAKGLGSYIPPSLTDASNWYAKIVDLLLNQQAGDGSWPADLRDDGTALFAGALAVAALGLVAVPPTACGPVFNEPKTYKGSVPGDVIVKGPTVFDGANVGGGITVKPGGAVIIKDSMVHGAVQSNGATSFTATNSWLGGDILITASTGFVQIGGDEGLCKSNKLDGLVTLSKNKAGVEFSSNTSGGSMAVTNNTASTGSDPDGGPAATEVEGNKFGGDLRCSGNSPTATNGAKSNMVSGTRYGECAAASF